ncbi:hypothetical protein D9611_007036 [Ephemerocybe angulata]|uniref:Uncharacterized protein n=1 Tax=Ephemerocybe angulata TaxID=980116 RepID=A0A8H5EWH2_9AGAR|nr:hypothetical protein D9611_007036 [Tulosesus angulatus]
MSPVPRCLPHSAEVSRPPSRVTTLINMRAIQMSENRPFHYRYIDKPAVKDGKTPIPFASFLLEAAASIRVKIWVRPRLPGSERRYRLVKGGHPSLVLVHYTRGPPAPISPGVANLPVRVYPLRTVNEPPTIVIGDKAGQKFYPPGTPGPGMQPPPPPSAVNITAWFRLQRPQHINDDGSDGERSIPSSLLYRVPQHFSLSMNNLNTQQRTIPALASIPDEMDQISTLSLALTRYKRNHEFMNDVFRQAAFGMSLLPVPPYRHTPVFPRAR